MAKDTALTRGAVLLACAIIVSAAAAAYCNSFSGPFVLDDVSSISDNPTIRHLWPLSVPLSPPHGGGLTVEGRPILNLSLAVNYALGGLDVRGYHATNLLIHVLAGLTLFGIVRRTLARGQVSYRDIAPRDITIRDLTPSRSAPTAVAFAIALLWTLHPLQTESVTYIIQRAESLMGLFYLLTLYFFIRSAEPAPATFRFQVSGLSLPFAALSVVACFLGGATKEVMVSAPLVVLLYDRTFHSGSLGEAWRRRRAYYAALATSWILLAILVIHTGNRGGTSGLGIEHLGGVSGLTSGAWNYWLTQFPAVVRYLRLALWPSPLIFDYGTEWVSGFRGILGDALIVAALLAATGWAVSRPLGRPQAPLWRALGFLGCFFFVILAPTSLVPGNRQTMAEHRMYLALIPFLVVVVLAIGFAVRLIAPKARNSAFFTAVAVLALVLGLLTFQRNRDYRSVLALYADSVAKHAANAFAQCNLGVALFSLGRVPEAIVHYQEAIRLRPDYPTARENLGNALLHEGLVAAAAVQFEEALRLSPGLSEAQDNLGVACVALGRLPDAVGHFNAALRLDPGSAEFHANLANALSAEGNADDAIVEYRAALRLDPGYPEAHYNFGRTLLGIGRLDEAAEQFREAIQLNPGYAEAHNNCGNALLRLGRISEAASEYEEAVRLQPGYAIARYNLGNALLRLGREPEAVVQFRHALRDQPDFPQARAILERLAR